MPLKSTANRYGSISITIHWLTAALIVALLITGLLAADQADDLAKAALLRAHVPLGISVLVLTLFRLVWRLVADRLKPPSPADEPAWRRRVSQIVHIALYGVILVAASSGIGTIALSGALPAIIAGAGLPDFDAVPPRAVHGLAPRLLLVLLALHIGAALYHQFILRDRLLARMGIGR